MTRSSRGCLDKPAAENLLRRAAAVDIGRIDEIAAGGDEAVEHRMALRLARLAPEGHGAEAKLADAEAGFSKKAEFHVFTP